MVTVIDPGRVRNVREAILSNGTKGRSPALIVSIIQVCFILGLPLHHQEGNYHYLNISHGLMLVDRRIVDHEQG